MKKILKFADLPFSFLLKITGIQEENFKFTGPLQEVYQIFTGDLQEIFIFHRRITGFYITDFHILIDDMAMFVPCLPSRNWNITSHISHPKPDIIPQPRGIYSDKLSREDLNKRTNDFKTEQEN